MIMCTSVCAQMSAYTRTHTRAHTHTHTCMMVNAHIQANTGTQGQIHTQACQIHQTQTTPLLKNSMIHLEKKPTHSIAAAAAAAAAAAKKEPQRIVVSDDQMRQISSRGLTWREASAIHEICVCMPKSSRGIIAQ
jgi:hypothetical protein